MQKVLCSNELLGSWTYGLINNNKNNNNYMNLLLTGYECKPVKILLTINTSIARAAFNQLHVIGEGLVFCMLDSIK